MQDKKDAIFKIKQLQKDAYMKHINKMQTGGMFPQPANTPYMGFPYGEFQYNPEINFPAINNTAPTGVPNLGINAPQLFNPQMDNNYMAAQGQQMTGDVLPEAQPLNTTVDPMYQDINRTQIFNPYSGVSLENALFSFGQSLGYDGEQKGANTVRGAASAGKIALSGARSILSGVGYQKANDRAYDSYVDKLYNVAPNYSWMQAGGEVTNADVMTGAYAVGTPQFNSEVEHGEILQLPNGQIQEVVGETHEEGGVKTQLESGTKVLSDHTKIGAKNAKVFRKDLDVKVKATDTFASVMDKYNNKVGWTDLIENEKKTIEQIGEQEKGDIDTTTKDINLNFLSGKLQELQAEKELVNPLQNEAFNKIFEKQETAKPADKKEVPTVMQEGGQFDPKVMELAQQYNLAPERVMELMQQQNPNPVNADLQNQVVQALQQGTPPEQVLGYLVENGMSQEEATQMLADSQQMSNAEVQSFQAGGTFNFFTPSLYTQEPYVHQNFVQGNTYAAGVESEQQILERLQYQNQQLPYLVRQSGIYSDNAGAFPNLQNTAKFQQAYDGLVDTTLAEIDQSEFLTPEQKVEYKKQAESQKLALSRQSGDYDNVYGLETSSRVGFNLPYLTVEEQKQYPALRFIGDAIDDKGQIKPDFANLSPETQQRILGTYGRGKDKSLNIGLGVIPTAAPTENTEIATIDPELIRRQVTTLRNTNLPVDFVLPPSPMQDVYKPSVSLGRIDPAKISIEPNLIEADRQRQSTVEALSFLPEAQRAAAISSVLGQTQGATNQAITGAEAYNADAQQKADAFNLSQRDKQQLLDAEINQTYEQKVFQTQANQESSLRRYFNQLTLNNRQNFADVRDLNLLNAATPNYQTDGQNIYFNDQPLNFTSPSNLSATPFNYASLSPAAKKEYEKQIARQLAKNKKV